MGKKLIQDVEIAEVGKKMKAFDFTPTVELKQIALALKSINPHALIPVEKLPEDIKATIQSLKPEIKRFHGAKISLSWFPPSLVFSPCNDKFGYLTSATVRASSKLDFNLANQALLNQLGGLMADPGREPANSPGALPPSNSNIPSGFTYFGQFVDHDITLDVSSSIDAATDAQTVNNMRTPALELDNLYGRGPALDPYLYDFPSSGPSTAIKFQLGSNRNVGPGGPSNNISAAGMVVQTNFDVPRVTNFLNPASSSNTAIIGDPRNDENLIVSQFHASMLKFHNKVVDLLVLAAFTGDIFVEAKKIVTQHYQWAVVNDYLTRICGATAVTNALTSVAAPIGSAFRMPVEFSVAAYRFGHSLIRDNYWVNHNFINASLGQVFQFSRNPQLPVLSNWVVNFNAFFNTGVPVPVFNFARKIDSILATGLETLPGGSGVMAILAARNLRRGLAMGLPSGQATATALGLTPMTTAQLTSGLPATETTILNSNGGILLTKTPLWYYILREAAVLGNGNNLGPVGAKIVAETFVRMLKRDAGSYLNVVGGFTPFLPSQVAGNFTVADLVIFSGVTQP
jgi:hypothetical protein